MTKGKKICRTIFTVLFILLLLASFGICGYYTYEELRIDRLPQYEDIPCVAQEGMDSVIFMIGDGMGFNHLKAGEAYSGETLFMRSFPVKGESMTYSRNVFGPTDSAAGGTALSCGKKVNNGNVAYYNGEDLETLTEYARKLGKATGVICTETMTGATPASFSAHAVDRGMTDVIFESQMTSGVDLFLCAGKSYCDEKTELIAKSGYEYYTDFSKLNPDADKVLGSFSEISTGESTDETPTLSDLVSFAVAYLDAKDEDGFFLMVEGSYIDKKSHSQDLFGMIPQLLGFDEAVETAFELAKDFASIIVTADHETGGLKYNGETKYELSDKLYTRGSHSSANVPYFVYGITSTKLPATVNNVQLSGLARQLLAA